jgi:serine/threonine protein kinase
MTYLNERSIFLEAIEIDDLNRRTEFVKTICEDNLALCASVQELLAAHESSDCMLDRKLVEGHPIDESAVFSPSQSQSFVATQHVGMLVGSFRLMEKIGEGGFGLVFVAQQEHPVKRKVALKIIKPGTGSKEVVARFELERQALAMMDHPNISRVFDAGVTEDGRPFFVMELVRGLPITEYCDNYQLNLEDRVRLFQDVCSAVQHAHQKGVIHRDLKPSNVMVTLHDDKAIVKVIDFGVAKAIGDDLTERTIYTRFYSMIGTPLYMSPEQAQMSGLDVDTRSDIYSLGVMLYELLAGTTPFERERLCSAGFDEMRLIIREEEPPLPSHRVSTLGNRLTIIADARQIQPSRLHSAMRGDLDWIVMKALEKDRNRRYESAAALASDLRRFLNQQPIDARPPSAVYQLAKFTRRHRKSLLTLCMLAASLLLGTIVSLWQMLAAIRESDQKDAALRKAIAAEKQATEARQEVEQFANRLTQANLLLTNGQMHAESELWSSALEEFTQATELQPSYYLPWVVRGQFYARLYMWKESAEDYQRALNLGAPVDEPQWIGVTSLFQVMGYQSEFEHLQAKYFASEEQDVGLAQLAQNWLDQNVPPPHLRRPPRGFAGDFQRAERLPPIECEYICGLAFLRAGRHSEAVRWLRSAAAREWPARGLVDAPLAIALEQEGKSSEARELLNHSKLRIQDWMDQAMDIDSINRKLPWFYLAEAIAVHREATYQLLGTRVDSQPQIAALRTAAIRKLDAMAK